MKFSRAVVAIATAAAVFTGGVTVPQSLAETRTTQEARLHWPTAYVVPGDTVEVKPEGSFPSTMRFSGEEDYLGYRLTTNPFTGVATITVSEDVIPGETSRFYITATDGFQETDYPLTLETVPVEGEMARRYKAYYEPIFTEVAPAKPRSTRRLTEFPEGTRFVADAPQGLRVDIDAEGTLTVEPAEPLPVGWNTEVAVTALFPDGSYDVDGIPVVVVDDWTAEQIDDSDPHFRYDNEAYTERFRPRWDTIQMTGDERAVSYFTGDAPEGTTFTFREDLSPFLRSMMDIEFNQDTGEVALTPKRPIKGNRDFAVPIEMTYPDGQNGLEDAVFSVTTSGMWMGERAVVDYETVEAPTPGPFTSVPRIEVPDGTWFEFEGEEPEGWKVNVDRTTGEVTLHTPDGTRPDTNIRLTTVAHFPDDSRKFSVARFKLMEPEFPEAETTKITYPDVKLKPGETTSVSPDSFPEGAAVSLVSSYENKLDISADSATGVLTFEALDGAEPANYPVNVNIIFRDGTLQEKKVLVQVEEPTEQPAPEPSAETTAQPESEPTPEEPTEEPTEQPTPEPEEPQPTPEPEPEATEGPTPDVFEPADVTEEEPGSAESSSTGGIIAIVLEVLAALGGLAFAAKPQLEKMGLWPDLPFPTA
mgnify:CR=1 FL=1